MKVIAAGRVARLWMMVFFAGLSMVSIPSISSAAKIGDNFGGGVVFYVDGSGQHGLIAAKKDLQGHSSGKDDGLFTWNDAKTACSKLVINGYKDWILPNKLQLNQLYSKKFAIGGFATSFYWSSSEGIAGDAWLQHFNNGGQYQYNQGDANRVRVVRAF